MDLPAALARIEALEAENVQLKQRLQFLEYAPTLAVGMQGEQLVARAVGGVTTPFTAAADVIARNDELLEVKFSTLNTAVRGRKNATTRWTWPRPLGYKGSKMFDRLILVGQADTRYAAAYADNEPYVFFDVPFCEAQALTILGGTHRNIQITTNPRTAKTPAAIRLFSKFMLSFAELNSRYGITRAIDAKG
jgi:hypothetical protein